MSAAIDVIESTQVSVPQTVTATPQLMPLTAERKLLCAEVLLKTGGNVTKAAELLGTTRQNIHRWAQTDPAFRELFDDAIEGGTDNLEENYYYRALNGSDRATEFLLRARRPEKYRDVAPSVETPASGEIASEVVSLLVALAERNRAAQAQPALPPASGVGPVDQSAIETTAAVTDGPVDQTAATTTDNHR